MNSGNKVPEGFIGVVRRLDEDPTFVNKGALPQSVLMVEFDPSPEKKTKQKKTIKWRGVFQKLIK